MDELSRNALLKDNLYLIVPLLNFGALWNVDQNSMYAFPSFRGEGEQFRDRVSDESERASGQANFPRSNVSVSDCFEQLCAGARGTF